MIAPCQCIYVCCVQYNIHTIVHQQGNRLYIIYVLASWSDNMFSKTMYVVYARVDNDISKWNEWVYTLHRCGLSITANWSTAFRAPVQRAPDRMINKGPILQLFHFFQTLHPLILFYSITYTEMRIVCFVQGYMQ